MPLTPVPNQIINHARNQNTAIRIKDAKYSAPATRLERHGVNINQVKITLTMITAIFVDKYLPLILSDIDNV